MLLREVVLPELAQEEQPLRGLLPDGVNVGGSFQVPGDC